LRREIARYNHPVHARGNAASGEAAERGFTLIELMVVIAIVGLLAVAALVFVNPRSFAATSRGYAQEVASLCDSVRQRAVASRTYQKLEVQDDQIIHWQGDTTGMTPPTDWSYVGTTPVPSEVRIASTSDVTHIEPGDSVPSEGAGLPAEIDFAPDGSATAATIFVTDSADENKARVAIYRATGSAYAYYEW
jgi:prepilin-type N-terminal cleavage/methylation domain-containing protein